MILCCLSNFARRTACLVLAPVISLAAASTPAAEPLDELRLQRCFTEISQANQAFADGRADIANERLLQLTHSCSGVAHLYHNLGAIAALRRDWEQAITYLEQSLAIDQRAALTQAGLSGIYQYKAALAYRKALDLSGPQPKPPAISLQDGDTANGPVANPNAMAAAAATAREDTNIDPIELVTDLPGTQSARSLDLAALRLGVTRWWTARRELAPELPPWSAVGYSVDELENDLALVLLVVTERQQLLVMRKTGTEWQIILEKQL